MKKFFKALLCIFLCLIVIFVALVAIVSITDEDTITQLPDQTNNVPPTNTSIDDVAPVATNPPVIEKDDGLLFAGENAVCDYYGGEYAITMKSATLGTKYNDAWDEKPDRILIIDYAYENISSDTDVTFSYVYMRVYDNDGNLLEYYPSTETKTSPGMVSKGHKTTASVAYGLNCDSNEITVDVFSPVFEKLGTFKLTIE